MTRFVLFILIGLFLSLSACDNDKRPVNKQSSTKKKRNPYLPQSTGNIDEILLVMSDNLWESTPGDSLRSFLNEDYEVIPQQQPIFDVRRINGSAFGSLFKKAATIMVVGVETENDLATQLVKKQVEKFKSQYPGKKVPPLFSASDVWSAPQNVIFLFAKDRAELIERIITQENKIVESLYKLEDDKAFNNVYVPGVDFSLTKKVKDIFKLDFNVPKSYQLALEDTNAIWLRMDDNGEEAVINVFVHKEDYDENGNSPLQVNYGIEVRDKLGVHVKSDNEGAYMYSDTVIPFIHRRLRVEDQVWLESRGVWRLKDDFIGGPFLTYCFDDPVNKRVITLDGFVYAPQSRKKRKLMRKLEVLFQNIRVAK